MIESPKPPRPPSRIDNLSLGSSPVTQELPILSPTLPHKHHLGRISADHTCRYAQQLDIGTHTLPGTRYSGLNQDHVVVQEMYAQGEIPKGGAQVYVLAICDGHGILGDKSACFAGKALARYVYSSKLRNKHIARMPHQEVEEEMKAAFKKAHHAANLVYDMPPKTVLYPPSVGASKVVQFSLTDVNGIKIYRSEKGNEKMLECGTTCTAAIVQGRCVCLANVGDSLAVIGHEKQGTVTWETVTLRHHGLLDSERERIQTEHRDTTQVLEDGYIKVHTGPWAGYELAVTRALGHKNMEQYGVLDEPHCVMLDLDPADHSCLVIASDGLWDVMCGQEVVEFVMEGRKRGESASVIAHRLVETAVDKGLNTLDEQDNTSAIVVFFRQQGEGLVGGPQSQSIASVKSQEAPSLISTRKSQESPLIASVKSQECSGGSAPATP